jgi:uncharacterized RDD family membrane protein YckC
MRNFSARETEWMLELDGIELAGFRRRALAFVIDWILISFVFVIMAALIGGAYLGVRHLLGKPMPNFAHVVNDKDTDYNFNIGPGHTVVKDRGVEKSIAQETIDLLTDVIVPVLYFGILLWRGKGRTPGKRLMKIRVVSIVHRHLSFWHCVERALGYGAAALELGFGFIQFFIHPYRRCAQDRLAETIVVTERGYLAMQYKFEHPLIPDTTLGETAPE